ncbi:alpha/beta fold hydrolase [Amycolatopsis endophytica]|uniref:Pimeloyl-ACP methyl ester carboxylesterase n=1 Tax=Amycolatopsis endophytica TaxID=860233 RepID=A0A853BFD2_9PSEU|nr:alpha/beta fold hydrolase [Amycolatopsis endophytica]NYI93382.1 pimeloyl-ACP methyl ester carboxylesterase [Amycolatopsis endophytica]
MDYVDVRGVRTRYRIAGDGPPALLLHGIGRSLRDWSDQQDLLADEYRTYSLDLAGFGHSDPLPGKHTLEALAAFAVDFLDAVGETRPVHVAGNSLGGAVAMRLSVDAPSRVRSLVLANSAGFGREVTVALRLLALRPLGKLLLRPSVAGAVRTERALFFDRAHATRERIEQALEISRQPHAARVMLETARGLGGFRGVSESWRRPLLDAVAAQALPTLVVWGDRDLILPALHLEAAHQALPHAQTRLFTDTGHMPQIERAKEFHDLVAGFWGSRE